ncbi:hypothetical protein Plhal304r1_c085g0168861 [Plasmopara halstedii]
MYTVTLIQPRISCGAVCRSPDISNWEGVASSTEKSNWLAIAKDDVIVLPGQAAYSHTSREGRVGRLDMVVSPIGHYCLQ